MRTPHHDATNGAPEPVWYHHGYGIDKGNALHPHHTAQGCAIHEGESVKQHSDQGKPEMCAYRDMRRLLPGESRYDGVDKAPKHERDDAVHGHMGVGYSKVGEMPEQVGKAKGLYRSLH